MVRESFATPVSPNKTANTRQQDSRARAAGLDTEAMVSDFLERIREVGIIGGGRCVYFP